jgi:hypothetical protein
MQQYCWRPYDEECLVCGEDVEILTDSGEDNWGYDGDQARCVACPQTGYLSVDEAGAHINWHDEE